VSRSYDAANRLSGVSDWLQHTISFGYDANSNLTGETYPNTTAPSFAYDAADQLTGITDSKSGTPFWSFGYGRDANGQLSSSSDPVENANHSYGYDTLNRLTSDLKGTAPTTYTYDPADELKTITNTSTTSASTFSYDTADELTTLQKVVGTSTVQNLTLSSNANGDRSQQTDSVSGSQVTYSYDQADRLARWQSGNTAVQYGYDGDGLRQSKTVGSSTTNQLWDLAEGMPLLVQDGTTRYITGPGGLPIEQVDGSNNVLYYYQDQLGSTRGLLDGSGNTQATYTFDPYGNVTSKTGSATTPFGYAGQYTDSESGLQYLRARY
jgi:YD repeat-containing protein